LEQIGNVKAFYIGSSRVVKRVVAKFARQRAA